MARLTKRFVDTVSSAGKTQIFWDEDLRGFGLRMTSHGAKAYVIQYRTQDGRSRRFTIGKHGPFTPDEARKEARQLLASVARGEDPASDRSSRRHAPSVNELADRYLAEYVSIYNKPRTQAQVTRLLKKRIRPQLGMLKIRSVTRADVAKLHHAMAAIPREANHTLAVISKMMNLAEAWGLRDEGTNPCRLIRRYPEQTREYFMTDEELRRLGEVLKVSEVAQLELAGVIRCIRLLALTGCRLGEIRTLRWEYVDLDRGLFMLPDTKTGGRVHSIGKQAIALLSAIPDAEREGWVVTGRDPDKELSEATIQHAWRRIRKKAKMEHARLHDLRHTVGTYAGQTGANAFLIRDKLGHRTVAMTGRYVGRDIAPLRMLSDQIEDRIAAAMLVSDEVS